MKKSMVVVLVFAVLAIIFFPNSCGAEKSASEDVKVSLPDDVLFEKLHPVEKARLNSFVDSDVPNKGKIKEVKFEVVRFEHKAMIFIKALVFFRDGQKVAGSTTHRKNVVDDSILALKAAVGMPTSNPFASR
jgi:hypothetical protein